jgi:Cdc6-like AAA superfamily ATPase
VAVAALDNARTDRFVVALEEAARATGPTSTRFIEPAPGTLARALSNRNHLVFGRRGSGKTSVLQKARAEMLGQRRPNAYIDMEKFKGHTYPDVLISVLIETFENIRGWLSEGAVAPATKKSFWQRIVPSRKPLEKTEASRLADDLDTYVKELDSLLHSYDHAELQLLSRAEQVGEESGRIEAGLQQGPARLGSSAAELDRTTTLDEIRETLRRSKIDFLHRKIISYQKTLRSVVTLAGENGFILLDDLYHIRRVNQADVLDYFHRLFKGTGLWLKAGTIRHRSTWYRHGDPSIGVKLGDDVEEIDLDLTLEKYQTAKKFLFQVVSSVAEECEIDIPRIVNDGARDRLVLASGGVARDFLGVLRKSLAIAREQGADKVGTEHVNQAAGEYESTKRDEFRIDVFDEGQKELEDEFDRMRKFCLEERKKNCLLVEKDLDDPVYEHIKELVDLRLVHSIASRITVRHRPGRIYEAYMIDISQYTGERKRRNLDMVEFWKKDGAEKLRGASLIYAERRSSLPS